MEMSISVRVRVAGVSSYIHVPYRNCKMKDFKKRGLDLPEEVLKSYENRFCPEFDKYQDQVKIKNLYNDNDKRTSFSV